MITYISQYYETIFQINRIINKYILSIKVAEVAPTLFGFITVTAKLLLKTDERNSSDILFD